MGLHNGKEMGTKDDICNTNTSFYWKNVTKNVSRPFPSMPLGLTRYFAFFCRRSVREVVKDTCC